MQLISPAALLTVWVIAASPPAAITKMVGVDDAFALTGVDERDLARPFSGPGLDGPGHMASDPIDLPDRVLHLAGELSAEDPGAALHAAWLELGVKIPSHTPLDTPLRSQLSTRRDTAALRSLDPALQALLSAVALAAAELDTWQNAPPATTRADVRAALSTPRSWAYADIDDIVRDTPPAESQAELAALSAELLGQLLDSTVATATWPESPVVLNTAVGRLWIGTHGVDHFEAPFVAVLDPGGDDQYTGYGGPQRLSVTLDLGGDDVYRRLPPTPGGISIQIDRQGDDVYDDDGSAFGSAAWGCSILLDEAGDDTYRSGPWGLGAGLFGVGLLLDRAGDDTYRVHGPGQGIGGPQGLGALIDSGGTDVYVADADGAQGCGLGAGPTLPGGIGVLVDAGGHDTYQAMSWSQGCATWRGAGLAVDLAGDDRWSAADWSQGAAAHEGVGALLDLEGQDRYDGKHGVQGVGHDRGIGWLSDRQGDDVWRADGQAQGAASAGGLGCALDGAGDDAYFVAGRRWGATDTVRGEEAIALLLDAGGDDVRGPGAGLADGRASRTGRHGIGIDLSTQSRPEAATSPRSAEKAAHPEEYATLIRAASMWLDDPVGADSAIARLALAGPSVYPMLIARLDPANPAATVAAGRVLQRITAANAAGREDLLLRMQADLARTDIGGEAEHLLVWSARLSGDTLPAQYALAHLEHPNSAVRRAAAAVLEPSSSEPEVRDALLQVLEEDPSIAVRATAVRSLGRCRSRDAVAPLVALLPSSALALRDATSRSLVLLARDGLDAEVRVALRPGVAAGNIAALEAVSRVPDPLSVPHLIALLERGDPAVRGHAALALGAVGNSAARKALLGREAVEAHPFVIDCLDRALRTPGNAPAIAPDLE